MVAARTFRIQQIIFQATEYNCAGACFHSFLVAAKRLTFRILQILLCYHFFRQLSINESTVWIMFRSFFSLSQEGIFLSKSRVRYSCWFDLITCSDILCAGNTKCTFLRVLRCSKHYWSMGGGVLRGGLRRARGATDVARFEAPGGAWRRLRAT